MISMRIKLGMAGVLLLAGVWMFSSVDAGESVSSGDKDLVNVLRLNGWTYEKIGGLLDIPAVEPHTTLRYTSKNMDKVIVITFNDTAIISDIVFDGNAKEK